ncbi:MAG: hypothetical protein ABH840_01290 [Nanoarchaeota archaeon]
MQEVNGFQFEGPVLYNECGIVIAQNPRDEEGHQLLIGNWGTYLGRGVLRELSTSDRQHFQTSMGALSSESYRYALEEAHVSIEALRVAFAQARTRELEQQVSSLCTERFAPYGR